MVGPPTGCLRIRVYDLMCGLVSSCARSVVFLVLCLFVPPSVCLLVGLRMCWLDAFVVLLFVFQSVFLCACSFSVVVFSMASLCVRWFVVRDLFNIGLNSACVVFIPCTLIRIVQTAF